MIQADSAGEVWTIVVAGGSGRRFGAAKQFLDLGGEKVVDLAVRVAAAHSRGVVVVVPAAFVADYVLPAVAATVEVKVVAGADSRSGSVRSGLAAVPESAEVILVHDGARPLATHRLYERVIDAVGNGAEAVVPVVPVSDSIRHRSSGVVDRSELVAVQTPQGFAADSLRAAHASEAEATDDASLVEARGVRVELVEGETGNMKITDQSDLEVAGVLLANRGEKR